MIAIVDCGIGNVGSVLNMFRRIGAPTVVSGDPDVVGAAEKLVLPGVGAFDHGMSRLRRSGLIPTLERRVLGDAIPILGICLGLQLFTRASEEGVEEGLGWLPGRTVRFRLTEPPNDALKVPHMGWNTVREARPDAWPSLSGQPRFYFVHSYHVVCDHEDDVLATARYGYDFAAAVRRGTMMGVQFHPEKSHRHGMAVLRDFAAAG
jgi:imidazole glycerol-phosphate synthase subunit HisH